jgi:hypothetical protein
MHLYLLKVTLTDPVRFELHLDLDRPVRSDCTMRRDVAERRPRIGVADAIAHLLQDEINLEIADVLYLQRPLRVLLKQHPSHIDQPGLRLNLHLGTHPLPLQNATDSILASVELEPLLESLLLNGLEFDDCPEGLAALDLSHAVEHVERTEDRDVLLAQFRRLPTV